MRAVPLIFLVSLLTAGVKLLAIPDPPAKEKPEAPSADIQGYYTCKGLEVGGKEYRGVTVVKRVEDTYIVTWVIGPQSFTGAGILKGDVFSVGWVQEQKGGVLIRGVTLYKVAGKKLTGHWLTVPGPGVAQAESLTYLKGLED